MQEIITIILTICIVPLMIGVNILMFYIIRDIRSGKR